MASPNVTYEQLLAFAAGDLPPDQAAAVETHMRHNPDAERTVRIFRLVRDAAGAAAGTNPPERTIAAAKALFRERGARAAAGQPGIFESLRQVLATLLFDSRAEPAYAGLRGAASGYQLSFESELGEIDLEVSAPQPGMAERQVRGQLSLSGPAAGITVALSAPGQFTPVTTTDADADGLFTLTAPLGRFDVLVASSDAVVVLRNIDVQ